MEASSGSSLWMYKLHIPFYKIKFGASTSLPVDFYPIYFLPFFKYPEYDEIKRI